MKKKFQFYVWVIMCVILLCFNCTTYADQDRSYNFSKNYTLSGDKANDLVLVAKAQLGKTQSNLGYSEAWCANFVTDCARLAGISENAIPYNYSGRAYVPNLYDYMISNCSAKRVYDRQPGDLLFYYCNACGGFKHVAIVEDSTYSIEGNYWINGISQVSRASVYYDDCNHTTTSGTIERWYIRPNYNTTPPTNITIAANQTQIAVGESVSFSYTIDGADSKHIGIDKIGSGRYHSITLNNTSGSVSYTFSEPGNYCIITEGSNSKGYECCDGVYVTVLEKRPDKPVLRFIKEQFKTNESVGLYWDNCNGATHYDVWIYKDGEQYDWIGGLKDTVFAKQYPEGNYSAFVLAVDSTYKDWYNKSNEISFSVSYEELVPINVKYLNGRIYSLYDNQLTWKEASEYCDSIGGHLATVSCEAETEIIKELTQSGERYHYYIGGSDANVDGEWEWVTGEEMIYTNWKEQEPNGGILENYLMIYRKDGLWNDIANYSTDENIGFICEIEADYTPFVSYEYDGREYMLFNEKLTWLDANAYCSGIGGHLVTIGSLEEQNIISELLKQGTNKAYYAGATDVENDGEWQWVTDEDMDYFNWSTNEPNGEKKENYLSLYTKQNEDISCGEWNDISNFNQSWSVGFICEKEHPNINATVIKKDESHTIGVRVYDIDATCYVLVAGYKNDKLITVESRIYSKENETFTATGDIDEIKVMVWDSLSALKPLCEEMVITNNEFITQ